jgi:hypothetical protein
MRELGFAGHGVAHRGFDVAAGLKVGAWPLMAERAVGKAHGSSSEGNLKIDRPIGPVCRRPRT